MRPAAISIRGVRRRRGQSDPCARPHHRRSARRARAASPCRAFIMAWPSCRRISPNNGANCDLRGSDFLGAVGLSVPAGEQGRDILEMVWSRPTCDVNGILGGYTGKGSKTVLPAQASAKFSFRLVGSQDPVKIAGSLPGFRQGASARRLPRRIYFAWRVGRAATALQFGGVVAGAGGHCRRNGARSRCWPGVAARSRWSAHSSVISGWTH